MNKNNIFIPIIIVRISITFIIISLLVFFSKGKPSFIKKKLQIGALLLTLTAPSIVACIPTPECYGNNDVGDSGDGGEYITDVIYINPEHIVNGQIFVNLSENTKINGVIIDRSSNEYSYRITETNVSPILVGENIYALDGAYDEDVEEFSIDFSNIAEGNYNIYFYNYNLEDQQQNIYYYIISYPLVIVNEKK